MIWRSSSGARLVCRERGVRGAMAVGSALTEGLVSIREWKRRTPRFRVAERVSSGVWKITQAGGGIDASRRADAGGTRQRAKRRAGFPARAFAEAPGRA